MRMKLLKPHCYHSISEPSSYILESECKYAKQSQFKAVKLKENLQDFMLRFCSLLARCTYLSSFTGQRCKKSKTGAALPIFGLNSTAVLCTRPAPVFGSTWSMNE